MHSLSTCLNWGYIRTQDSRHPSHTILECRIIEVADDIRKYQRKCLFAFSRLVFSPTVIVQEIHNSCQPITLKYPHRFRRDNKPIWSHKSIICGNSFWYMWTKTCLLRQNFNTHVTSIWKLLYCPPNGWLVYLYLLCTGQGPICHILIVTSPLCILVIVLI